MDHCIKQQREANIKRLFVNNNSFTVKCDSQLLLLNSGIILKAKLAQSLSVAHH